MFEFDVWGVGLETENHQQSKGKARITAKTNQATGEVFILTV
jgi:hypothetical protein